LSTLVWRKRRGSVTRDRCFQPTLDPLPVPRATAPRPTAIRDWPVCHDGQRTNHPSGAVAGSGRPSSSRGARERGTRPRHLTRDCAGYRESGQVEGRRGLMRAIRRYAGLGFSTVTRLPKCRRSQCQTTAGPSLRQTSAGAHPDFRRLIRLIQVSPPTAPRSARVHCHRGGSRNNLAASTTADLITCDDETGDPRSADGTNPVRGAAPRGPGVNPEGRSQGIGSETLLRNAIMKPDYFVAIEKWFLVRSPPQHRVPVPRCRLEPGGWLRRCHEHRCDP